MSFVELRVELPAYAHSFLVQVPRSCNVLEVKQEIFRACVGGPRPQGQRIIWRGRNLGDHEKVEDLWKSLDEPRIIHLAVHPSAWSSAPPQVPQAAVPSLHAPTFSSSQTPRMAFNPQGYPIPPPQPTMQPPIPIPHPLAFIHSKHEDALHALMHGRTSGAVDTHGMEALRLMAKQVVERNGYIWPIILDEDFPVPSDGGLKYEPTTLEGQPYLLLKNPSDSPTAIQVHALKILSYTFTLRSISVQQMTTTRVIPSQPVPLPPNVNQLLQQLGLPQLRVPAERNPPILANGNALREIPIRPLLAPLLMLLFRTALLLYFVAPARKPIFGILIFAWMLWEIWVPIRNGIIRGWRRALAEEQQRQGGGDAPQGQQAVQPGFAAQQNAAAGVVGGGRERGARAAGDGFDHQANVVLENLGNMNINAEEQIINQISGPGTEEPGLGHKVMTFVGLLVTTMHPAVWNRRRTALGQREGRIRTEASVRATPPPEEGGDTPPDEARSQRRAELIAQHDRRPEWVQRYIGRVVDGDWVDDSD